MQVDGKAFGVRLREMRRRRGWSVHDLHDVTGVAASTISELERGKTASPEPWVTHALALAFGCPSAGDMVAWLSARERGEPYAPAAGTAPPFGPPRVPVGAPVGPQAVGEVRLDVLVELLLRGLWRAQASGPGDGEPVQLTTLGVGLFLLSPRRGRSQGRQTRRRGGRAPRRMGQRAGPAAAPKG
jgi:DNA-binding XRE family transcriptional regulator